MKRRRALFRCAAGVVLVVGWSLAIAACGDSSDDSTPAESPDGASIDAPQVDVAPPFDAHAPVDASVDAPTHDARADAARAQNECGGYEQLELDGHFVVPGHPCGACNDGTIACVGSNVVECVGASNLPCADAAPPFDAGPNACGGFGSLTYLSADASPGDPCGDCGYLQCATGTALACTQDTCAIDGGLAATCTVPDSAFTAVPTPPTLPPEIRPTVASSTSLALPATDLAFDPQDGLLYASISSEVAQGSSVAVIDPVTATIVDTIYVGADPSAISLSDDGRVLWVALANPAMVRRIDLTTRHVDRTILLSTHTYRASDVEALPGTEDSIAVLMETDTGSAVLVFDGSIPRPYGLRMGGSWILPTASSSLLYAGSYGYVYGACIGSTGAFTLPVSMQGSGDSDSKALFSQGSIYESGGDVFDAKTGASRGQITLPWNGRDYMTIATDPSSDVYFVSPNPEDLVNQVTAVDRSSLVVTGTDVLERTYYGTLKNLVRWGRYGLAFDDGPSIVIARTPVIPDEP